MKTPTFDQIKQLAKQDYPDTRIGIAHLLSAWAHHDPDQQLDQLLNGTGLSKQDLIKVLVPFIKEPQPEEFKIVTLCLLDKQASTILGIDLIETICKNPSFRICKTLFHAGMDFKRLIYNLNDQHLAPAGMAEHLENINPDDADLAKFTRNLNQFAKDGQFDDLIGREDDIRALCHIMLRRKKCNAILTGQPGIGKTVIVRLLAKKIVQGDVPNALKKSLILELDIPGVVAGTIYRGQFEERLKKILNAAMGLNQPVILFMDEIHMIMGAGKAKDVNTDGANILKPYLTDKSFGVIGATTIDEYHQHIAKDKAFSRRFEQFPVSEPDKDLTHKIVSFQAQVLSDYHGVKIANEIVDNAIDLTTRHIPHRCQPDKSIDLLDICCAVNRNLDDPRLTEKGLLAECARITGRDIEYLSSKNKTRLLDLENKINAELIGQKESVTKMCDTIIYRRLGVGSQDRPLGGFMLSGRSGIGKTTFAQLLARHFYGTCDALLHLDMAEYREPNSFSKLVGTAPGYIGHESSPGELTQWLRRHGSGVILFDEIEKAHPDVCQSLLGLLDNGRITSSSGEPLDARQCIILATTNALAASQLNKRQIGFQKNNLDQTDIKPMLLDHFSSEFLNRFDELLLFKSLGIEEYKKIITLRLDDAVKRFLQKNISINMDKEKLLQFFLDKLNRSGADARGINKILERELLLPISKAVISASDAASLEVVIDENFYSKSSVKIIPINQHSIVQDNRRHIKC